MLGSADLYTVHIAGWKSWREGIYNTHNSIKIFIHKIKSCLEITACEITIDSIYFAKLLLYIAISNFGRAIVVTFFCLFKFTIDIFAFLASLSVMSLPIAIALPHISIKKQIIEKKAKREREWDKNIYILPHGAFLSQYWKRAKN